jgi:hypothetical protein
VRVVISNSEADIAHQRAVRQIEWPLRDLLSNLLRVTRGAGKPHLIGEQAASLVLAFQDYRKVVGLWPASDEIARTLRRPVHERNYELDISR